MVPAVADWVIPLFFVAAMIVLSKARVRLVHESREGYRYIACGLAVFAFISLARLYVHSGLFDHVPFVSDPLFYRLLEWIGIITGTVFMVSGISNWLPLSSASRVRRELKIKHLEFVRAIEQLTQVESRADRLLTSALEQMVAQFHFEAGAVYRYSARTRRLYRTATVTSDRALDLSGIELTFDPDGWARYRAGIKPELAGICLGFGLTEGHPTCVLPIVVDERPAGFFFLWAESETSLEEDERLNLRIAVDIMARKFAADRIRLKVQAVKERECRVSNMTATVNQGGRLKEVLPRLAADMRELVPFDVFSLLLLEDDRELMTRFTLGENGALLVEKGLRMSAAGVVAAALARGEIVVPPADTLMGMHNQPGLETLSGCHSLLLAPISSEARRPVVACFGNRMPSAYGHRAVEMAEAVRMVLTGLLHRAGLRRQLAVRDHRMSHLAELTSTLESTRGGVDLTRVTVRWLANEFRNCSVLAAEYHSSEASLTVSATGDKLQVGYQDEDSTGCELPITNHRRTALETGRCVIHQSGEHGEIGAENLVLPLRVNEVAAGLIEIRREKSATAVTFSRAEVLLATTATRMLGLALGRAGGLRPGANVALVRRHIGGVMSDGDLRTHVKSSLAGILGSIELLESRGSGDVSEFQRYLSIMNRSAHRLSAYVDREEAAVPVGQSQGE